MLETARAAARRAGGAPTQVRFAFWGAEEQGLLGSTSYVTSLSAAEPTEDQRST